MTANPAELPPLKILLTQLDWNLQWLQQMEKNKPTDYYRDAALQRFEFTFNTAVKCIQAGALKQRITCETPEECFALAERVEWLPEGTAWQSMLQDYENMKPESASKNADAVFTNLEQYRQQLKTLFDRLSELEQNS
ncbi:MAG: nucleotidyltransferase substrate binding protein [Nitrospinota bacterium]|nr:nucleotidyltransferase substrate binding protein [Nitrospinota bacterium]